MHNTHPVAVALVAVDSVIDKLELETYIPQGDRTFLGTYQAKLAAGVTRIDEDMLMLKIFTYWVQHIQKNEA